MLWSWCRAWAYSRGAKKTTCFAANNNNNCRLLFSFLIPWQLLGWPGAHDDDAHDDAHDAHDDSRDCYSNYDFRLVRSSRVASRVKTNLRVRGEVSVLSSRVQMPFVVWVLHFWTL